MSKKTKNSFKINKSPPSHFVQLYKKILKTFVNLYQLLNCVTMIQILIVEVETEHVSLPPGSPNGPRRNLVNLGGGGGAPI